MPIFCQPIFSRGAPTIVYATTMLIVVAQYPSVRHGYLVVVHDQASARRLTYVWVSLFLLVY
jgi:diadenosine tetraphosphate (Ap4A) HIT family hydrolase